MVYIRLTTVFAERIGGISSVELDAATVESALRTLTCLHPALGPLIWRKGTINPALAVFANDEQVGPDALGRRLEPGATIDIIPAVAGG
jgi:molybdopterin converting factor small subunit